MKRQYHLIYDDHCPLCRAGMEQVKRHDAMNLVEAVPLSRALELNPKLAVLSKRLQSEMHLITPDGTVYRGAEALANLATLLPKSRILGKIILLPVIRPVARHVYRFIARHRRRL